jgi:hypothetical protein|tara:strand:- start:144 stop:449 length:306 start_codon:yes stop_codon:yes gene_type:complete
MKMEVNEFIYDICEEIYEELCRLNCNKNISESILIDNINDIVDNKLINISTYEYNVILLSYGINNAVNKYALKYKLNDINTENFSRIIIKNLIMESFEIAI